MLAVLPALAQAAGIRDNTTYILKQAQAQADASQTNSQEYTDAAIIVATNDLSAWVLDYAYPLSNPSGFVTSSVTNGVIAEVVGVGDVSVAQTGQVAYVSYTGAGGGGSVSTQVFDAVSSHPTNVIVDQIQLYCLKSVGVITNVAYGADISTSGQTWFSEVFQGSFPASNGFDKNTGTGFSAAVDPNLSIGQDFVTTKAIRKIRVFGSTLSFGLQGKLQYASDTNTWSDTDLSNIVVSTSSGWNTYTNGDFGSNRYWRILNTAGANFMQGMEIEMMEGTNLYAPDTFDLFARNPDGTTTNVTRF